MSNTDNRENLKQKIINIVKYIVLALCLTYILSLIVPRIEERKEQKEQKEMEDLLYDARQSLGTTNHSNSSHTNYSDKAGDYEFRDSNDNIWITTLQSNGRAVLTLNGMEIDYGTWEVGDWWDDELEGCIEVTYTSGRPYIVYDHYGDPHRHLWFRNQHVYTNYEAAQCEHPRKRLRYYKLDSNL